jgi:hypothetical protein
MATSQTLAALVARARDHRMSPMERRTQRVSLIMGLKDKNSTLTREKVEALMDEHEGHASFEVEKR